MTDLPPSPRIARLVIALIVVVAAVEQQQPCLAVQPPDAKAATALPPSTIDNAASDEIGKQTEATVAQQRAATATLQDLKSKQSDMELAIHRLDDGKLDDGPPYTILLMDEVVDSLASDTARRETLEESILTAREAVERARVSVEDHQRELRQLKETSPEGDPEVQAAEQEVLLAEEVLVLRRQELSIAETTEALRSMQVRENETKLKIIGKQLKFTREMLNEQIAETKVRENELNRRATLLQSETNYAEQSWMEARQELDSNPEPTPANRAKVESLKTAQQTTQLEVAVVNQRLQRLPIIRTAWERRFELVEGDVSRDDRRKWIDETKQSLDTLDRERRARELKLDEIRTTLGNLTGKLENAGEIDAALRRWNEASQTSLNRQISIYNDSIFAIENSQRVLNHLLLQLEGSPGRTFSEWLADAWSALQRFWNYELANVEDISLTVGKILSTLLFLVFGFFAAKFLSHWLGNRLPKWGVEEAGAHAIESLSFYVMLIGFALASLKYASVPLTVFTFLGGAIAIGVGFGSQNILNNFISGLILLAERPIKAGDLIMVDDTYGNVKTIGARSTTIRTGENLDIIVPNSKFLENNVVNLTRRDDRLRTSINVGVAYGSPLETVVQLLERAANENESVHERPKPFVWFNDFGDNALAFQVHFWINARTVVQRKKIETEVRMAIDRLFKEADVVIAFPQRDLHVRSSEPIEFRVINE